MSISRLLRQGVVRSHRRRSERRLDGLSQVRMDGRPLTKGSGSNRLNTAHPHHPHAALASSMGSLDEEDEYHPSLGHKRQPHHPSKELLWERIRAEAWSDAVRARRGHLLSDADAEACAWKEGLKRKSTNPSVSVLDLLISVASCPCRHWSQPLPLSCTAPSWRTPPSRSHWHSFSATSSAGEGIPIGILRTSSSIHIFNPAVLTPPSPRGIVLQPFGPRRGTAHEPHAGGIPR